MDTSHALWDGSTGESSGQGGTVTSQAINGVNGASEHMDSRRGTASSGTVQAEGLQNSKNGHTGHDHHAGHTLKNLVGGIFRHNHSHPPPDRSTQQQPHTIVRSQPVRPPDIPVSTHPPIPVLGSAITEGGEKNETSKTLTPRVRSREERSPDTRDVDIGDALDVGKRRARVD